MAKMHVQMPAVVHQDDGSLEAFEDVFNEVDVDHSKTIDLAELLIHYGHTSQATCTPFLLQCCLIRALQLCQAPMAAI
jgi:hypothetical protein